MANFAQNVRPDSVRAFHAQLFANATQPVCLASIGAFLLLWISLSVGATEVAIAILGALTYALFFKRLPVQRPSAKGKSISAFGASSDQSVNRGGVSAPNAANSLCPTLVTKPPPGLELPQASTKPTEISVDPQTPHPAGIRDFVCAAQEPCGLQRAKQGGPKAELEWGLHLRDTLMALSRTPTKPGEWKSTSNQQRSSTTNRQKQVIPSEGFEHAPTDENSLRANLRKLAQVEPGRIFMVKKIAQLGLKSEHFLRAHFEQLGTVEQVLVCHAVAKNCTGRERPRVRPGNTGFVVMATVEEASAALARGSVQTIEGGSVGVSKYVCRQAELGLDTQ